MRIDITSGSYQITAEALTFDGGTTASEVWLVGDGNVVLTKVEFMNNSAVSTAYFLGCVCVL